MSIIYKMNINDNWRKWYSLQEHLFIATIITILIKSSSYKTELSKY